MNKIGGYIKSILIPVIVGGVVGLITSQFMDYEMLQKPPFAPPRFYISNSMDDSLYLNGNLLWKIKNK